MGITHIVLTGGPCAGKSTGLAILEQKLTDLDYKVFVLDEMATNLIRSGVTYAEFGPSFQTLIAELSVHREDAYRRYLSEQLNSSDKAVILYDRGIMDGQAYCSIDDFNAILDGLNLQRNEVLGRYDGVFHLVTAADEAEEFYTTQNNNARTETPEQARLLDKRTLGSWVGHPHLRVIKNGEHGFEEKMNTLIQEVLTLLGEPAPLEIERKYLVSMPDIQKISTMTRVTKSEIVQTYLIEKEPGVERRLRQRGIHGDYNYYYTEKSAISFGTRSEKERKLSEKEYLTLLMDADTSKYQIRKDRYCFVFDDKYFELDVYPFWEDQAILEVEVQDITEDVNTPDFIEIIREVTADKWYQNSSLAVNRGVIE